jgi:hypothetical protein
MAIELQSPATKSQPADPIRGSTMSTFAKKTKADDTNATTKTVIKIITRHSRDINIRDK